MRAMLKPALSLCLMLSAVAIGAPFPLALAQEQAPASTSVITADRVIFDLESDTVTAAGNVELTRDNRRLLADELIFDQRTDRILARGNVVVLEPDGRAFFGDEFNVTGDLRDGTIEGFGALLGEQIRLAATSSLRVDGDRNILDQATYSPCPVCPGESPLWQIRSKRVIWDEKTKTVTYTNAYFELLGVPIGYTPIFSHPDPTVKQKTGFLTPTFGINSTLGLTAEFPYYVALAPNRDITITPLIVSNTFPLLSLEFRDRQTFGLTYLNSSGTYTEPSEENASDSDSNEFRGHLQGFGRYSLNDKWQTGFDLFVTSDETYLDRYDISQADLLTNDLYLHRIAGADFLGISAFGFQGLRPDDDQGTFPIVLPLLESRLRSSPMLWGSEVTLDSSLVALTRNEGIDTRRISSEVGWEVPWIGSIGELMKFRVSLRGDGYNYDGDPETLGGGEGTSSVGRIFPRATFDWSWPLVGDVAGFQYYLEPATMVTATPYNLNDDDIPNEDSQVFEFDETNLFQPDRFNGYDLVDDGVRVAYGLKFGSVGGPVDVSGVFGQSYSPKDSDDFPDDSGVRDNFSDYVGRIDLRPSNVFNVRYRYRIDKDTLDLRRNDIKMSVGPPQLRFDIGYLELKDEPNPFVEDNSREEITASVRVQATERLAFGVQVRRDLTLDEQVSNLFGLVYNHPCLQLVAGLEQSFTEEGDASDELTFKLRVTLTTLGAFRTGT